MHDLKQAVRNTCKELFSIDTDVEISYPERELGDFTTNVALKLAKDLTQPAQEIAKSIASHLKLSSIKKIEVAGPGFLNIVMTDKFWVEYVSTIGPDFGRSNIGSGSKVQLEFISANPTGPLTLANGRGGYAGDVLANVLHANGYEVEREYYINDAGNQIQALYNSVSLGVYEKIPIKDPKSFDNLYKGTYINDLAEELTEAIKAKYGERARGLSSLEVDKFVSDYGILELMLEKIRSSVKKMGIKFDVWFSEKENLHRGGARPIKEVLRKLESGGQTEKREGAVWLKGKTEARERVLIKSDGSYTYLLADLAYHWNKLEERGFDRAINFWGADHAGQVKSLQEGIKALDIDKPLDVIIFQLVRLIQGGKELKISKRAGTYITVDDLLDEVDPDVARWFFLTRDFNTHMDIDLDVAKEHSKKNPFYYVMYAYTRANSISRKAAEKQLKPNPSGLSSLNSAERFLIKDLSRLPMLLKQVAKSYEVHKLTFYGMELAKTFHDYYEQERIIDLPPAQAGPKLYLIEKFKIVLETYWAILGVKPRSKM